MQSQKEAKLLQAQEMLPIRREAASPEQQRRPNINSTERVVLRYVIAEFMCWLVTAKKDRAMRDGEVRASMQALGAVRITQMRRHK